MKKAPRLLIVLLVAAVPLVSVAAVGSAFWPARLVSRMNPPRVGFWHGDAEVRRVALTFDDGPDGRYTARILDILRERRAPATFFLVGRCVEREPALARRIVMEGHAVGNHSYSHVDLRGRSASAVRSEIDRAGLAIFEATGVRPELFRAPFGMANAAVLGHARDAGYTVVQWSLSSRDWQRPRSERLVSRVLSQARNGSVILLHDGSPGSSASREATVQALPALIDGLLERGYELVTVPELMEGRAQPQVARGSRS